MKRHYLLPAAALALLLLGGALYRLSRRRRKGPAKGPCPSAPIP